MDDLIVRRLHKTLSGRTCTEVKNNDGYLEISFGSIVVVVGTAWRVIVNGDLAVGSGSSRENSTKVVDILKGAVVTSVEVLGVFNEMRLVLGNGACFETFADSEGFEHWNFGVADTTPPEMIISGPGLLWSSFGVDEPE